MSEKVVAGIYLERSGGMVVRAREKRSKVADLRWPEMEVLDFHPFEWDRNDQKEAVHYLGEMGRMLRQSGDKLGGIAVASFGPFRSLKRSHDDFGLVQEEGGDLPLRGVNIFRVFRDNLPDARITVHTDANACALGEAMARNLPHDHVLVYLLVTEGIGAGIVTGRDIFRSALHPEMGLLHVRWDRKDPLRPNKTQAQYAKGLANLANNDALRNRYKIEHEVESFSDQMLQELGNDDLWDMRAYYLAQGVLACSAILSPHAIVVGADIDPDGRTPERVIGKFRGFLKDRHQNHSPMLRYDELTDLDTFITAPRPFAHVGIPPSIATTGAMGMALAAARVNRGGGEPSQLPRKSR